MTTRLETRGELGVHCTLTHDRPLLNSVGTGNINGGVGRCLAYPERQSDRATYNRTDLTTEVIWVRWNFTPVLYPHPYNSEVKSVMDLTSDNSNYNRGGNYAKKH